MSLTLVTAPTRLPVTLGELRDDRRMGTDETQDAHLEHLLEAATATVEAHTGRQLMTATWRLALDAWPSTIHVPRPPLKSVTSITYVDDDGATQTLAAAKYRVDTDATPGRITPAWGESWPSHRSVTGAIKVTFDAGHDEPADVPVKLRRAIMALAGYWFDNREPVVVGTVAQTLPYHVEMLLAGERHRWGG